MPDNLTGSSYITQTPPNTQGKARVDLIKSDFDALVWQKGYDVFLDKAIKCPCRNVPDAQGLSNCKNCGGSGWLFINRKKTRMVIQSMNIDTRYKEWSEEKLGTARITALNEEQLAYMDRITVATGMITTSQVLFFKKHSDGKWRAMCIYPILELVDAFIFDKPEDPLIKAEKGQDFEIVNKNWIELSETHTQKEHPTISLRYRHNPMFHVVDLTRNVMTTKAIQKGKDIDTSMPLSAVAKLAHYVLDEQNFNGDYLNDNDYSEGCDVKYTNKEC